MGKKGKVADSGPNADEGSSSDCLPCQQGCAYCKDDTPCVAREDGALRMAVLSFQCLCMLIVFISMVLIYHFRRNKVGIVGVKALFFCFITILWKSVWSISVSREFVLSPWGEKVWKLSSADQNDTDSIHNITTSCNAFDVSWAIWSSKPCGWINQWIHMWVVTIKLWNNIKQLRHHRSTQHHHLGNN